MKIVECVPNFSEGRDQKILDQIAAEIRSIKGTTLLDIDPGADTNRTVFTFVGEPEAVLESAFLAIRKAAELIDMSKHQGAHPRMGATDVCPLIPVSDITMEECVELAGKLGKRVGEELGIPVYLYEYAASKPEWKNLANVRKGEYEALPDKMKDPAWKPDFGPHQFNAKAGATAISAREFLIAYNINLNTRDKKKAHDLALLIRETGKVKRDSKGKIVRDDEGNKVYEPGLFTHCKAVGWYIDEYDRAQISINLTNYKVTPPHLVLEKVRELATESGINVTGSELVGLIPKEALLMAGKYYLRRMGESAGIPEIKIIQTAIQSMGLSDLGPFEINKKIIEYSISSRDRLIDLSLVEFADELSSDSPAPGGGSVAALCGTLSGALSAMVANLTFGKAGYEKNWDISAQLAEKGQRIKEQFLAAIDQDTRAFYAMMEALRLPKKTDEEKKIQEAALQQATQKAILVPLETMKLAWQAMELAEKIATIGNINALSDAGVAAITADSAARSAYLNIKINMSGITDESFKFKVLTQADELLEKIHNLAVKIEKNVKSKL
ncbi:MAG: glutamate formimidoyltransferase [Candidatus Cloacimonetes bacterium]|nr:glutamate formimidoyltransferase [Candidatus Cloacimonadota bacterium]